jgi:AcrR family transcriptional regulator
MSSAQVPANKNRRTQADRTAATKAALAEATIDLLIERGWASVTAIEVCNRVGVTRGAFHHHYERLPALLADALRRLYEEMRPVAKPAGPSSLAQMVDLVWAKVGAPRFKAIIEAWLAMANDPTLKAEIGPVVHEFATLVNPDSSRLDLVDDPDRRAFVLCARETMLGLALGRATNGGKPLRHEKLVLAQLRADAARLDQRHS